MATAAAREKALIGYAWLDTASRTMQLQKGAYNNRMTNAKVVKDLKKSMAAQGCLTRQNPIRIMVPRKYLRRTDFPRVLEDKVTQRLPTIEWVESDKVVDYLAGAHRLTAQRALRKDYETDLDKKKTKLDKMREGERADDTEKIDELERDVEKLKRDILDASKWVAEVYDKGTY